MIFASLVDDPNDPEAPAAFVKACRALPAGPNTAAGDTPRARLFDFIERLVQWESTFDERILEKARNLVELSIAESNDYNNSDAITLLDPFAGGGSIPVEGQRFGLVAHARDLNPVAVMINKALIEIPPRFADRPPVNPRDRAEQMDAAWRGARGLAADVRYYGAWMRERAWERIGHLYPTGPSGETVIAWLWARTVKSPNPAVDAHVPLVRSFELNKKKGRKAWVEPQVDRKTQRVSFVVRTGEGKAPPGTVERTGGRCIITGTPIPFDYIREEGRAGRMGAQLMAVVTEGQGGRNYYNPKPEHEIAAQVPIPQGAPDTNLPEQALSFRVQAYGMTKHRDLFTPRQLTALMTFSDLVTEAREQIRVDAIASGLSNDDVPLREGGRGARAYAEALSVYLAFALDKMTTTNSSLCMWETDPTRLVRVFSRQALPMVWDYAEANPFGNAAGDYRMCIESLAKVVDGLCTLVEGTSKKHDATTTMNTDEHYLVISTDPPYYDNIGYADLADYFYVWMRRSLRDLYPDVFDTILTPKDRELIASPYRHGGDKVAANQFFEEGLRQAFLNIRQVTLEQYPTTVFYAFKQSETEADEISSNGHSVSSTGWETMLESLIAAGYTVDGTWPIRTELTVALKKSVGALASSIILVCRLRPDSAPSVSRQQFVAELRQELPAALRELQSGNVAPVDLAQAAIGPGMAVFSRYARVLEPNGQALSVRAALQLINQELDAFLAQQEGDVDQDTRFAIAWFEQFGYHEAEFGVADVLARAKNTSVAGLVEAGVIEAGGGRVRLKHWNELDAGAWDPATDRRPTVWEGTHYLIERLASHGESGAAGLLAKMSSALAAEARGLAYRLYSVCERKGWAEHARDYNALVVSWPRLQELAHELRTQGPLQPSLL